MIALVCIVGGCSRDEPQPATVVAQSDIAAPAKLVTTTVPVPDANSAEAPGSGEDESEESPSIAAYPPVQIEKLVVRRVGSQAQLVARLSRAPGAKSYELQAAKTLMFEPLVAERRGPGRAVQLGPVPGGMFFVHARAIGPAGEGPFGNVRVIDARRPGVANLLPVEVATATSASVIAATTNASPSSAAKERLEQLQRELYAVETLRRSLQAEADKLTGQAPADRAKRATDVATELQSLGELRQQLDRDLKAQMAELERLR